MTPGPYTGLVGPYPRDPATGALLLSVPDQSLGARKLTDAARIGAQAPAGAIAENFPRQFATANTISSISGTMRFNGALLIPAGRTVTTLTCVSGNTALATASNQWAALYDKNTLALIGVTDDKGAAAWGANTPKSFTLATPYTPSVDTAVIPTLLVVATTMPTLMGMTTQATLMGLAPILSGSSNAGLTNPASAPATATAPGAAGNLAYCYAS